MLHSLHAPIEKKDCCGDKPVRIAEIYEHQECVRFLKKYDKKPTFDPLFFIINDYICLNVNVSCFFCICCRAESEYEAYRKKAALDDISLDDTDEEWVQQSKEHGEDGFVSKTIQET